MSFNFVTETVSNDPPSFSLPPNTVTIKDLNIKAYEEVYSNVNVIWAKEIADQLYITEDQCLAAATVIIQNKIYHKYSFTVRVKDADSTPTATQDIEVGDVITVDVDSLGLSAQKCEVLAKQRVIEPGGDRIEYNLTIAYYEIWS